jgi:hypothetical protein
MTKVGTSPGSSSQIAIGYDAGGSRLHDFRPGIGQRVYAGDHATFHRASTSSPSFDSAEIHIFAFGETIAYQRVEPVTLRTAGTLGALALRLSRDRLTPP